MDIHFMVRRGEILPHVESFVVRSQTSPCPPEIFNVLVHKIITDMSIKPSIRQLQYPFRLCPITATIEVLENE